MEWTVEARWSDPSPRFDGAATRPVTVLPPGDAPVEPAPVATMRGWSEPGRRRLRRALHVDGAPVARGDAVRVRYAPPASRFRTPPGSVEVSLELLERVAVHEGWAGPRAEQPLSFERAETVVARRVTTPGEEVVLEVPRDLPYGHAPRVPIVCGGGGSPCAPRATTRCSPPCRTVTPAVAAGS